MLGIFIFSIDSIYLLKKSSKTFIKSYTLRANNFYLSWSFLPIHRDYEGLYESNRDKIALWTLEIFGKI